MAPTRYESTDVLPAPLGEPLHFEFSGQTAPNRFLKAAMTERISSWHPTDIESRGVPSKELVNVYRRWGEGGYGLILTGNILFTYEHLEAAGNPIIPHGERGWEAAAGSRAGVRYERFKEMATLSKTHGALVLGQVNHPGRQVGESMYDKPISASDVQLEGVHMGMTFAKPKAATQEDIDNLIDGWAFTAEYLWRAGYDGIQLHCGE